MMRKNKIFVTDEPQVAKIPRPTWKTMLYVARIYA